MLDEKTEQRPLRRRKNKLGLWAMDILLVLTLIAFCAFALYVFLFGADPDMVGIKTRTRECDVTFLLSGIDGEYQNAVALGQKMTDAERKNTIGVVKEIRTETREDGKLDVTIVVTAEVTRGRYEKVAGERIAINKEYTVRFPNFAPSVPAVCRGIGE